MTYIDLNIVQTYGKKSQFKLQINSIRTSNQTVLRNLNMDNPTCLYYHHFLCKKSSSMIPIINILRAL